MLVRLALLPVVAAVSFETLMLLAKWDNLFVRALRAPGMMLQRLTTRQPDDGMVEVAIAAFAACLNEEERLVVIPEAALETADVTQGQPVDAGEPANEVVCQPQEADEAGDGQ